MPYFVAFQLLSYWVEQHGIKGVRGDGMQRCITRNWCRYIFEPPAPVMSEAIIAINAHYGYRTATKCNVGHPEANRISVFEFQET